MEHLNGFNLPKSRHSIGNGHFPTGPRIRSLKREKMSWIDWIAGIAALGLFIYLIYVLLRPEKLP